ncbi:hypothetical protein B1M_01543, partial [Burkholderia sp. TJI49]
MTDALRSRDPHPRDADGTDTCCVAACDAQAATAAADATP